MQIILTLDEMEKFSGKCDFPKLTQEEKENPNQSVLIEKVVKEQSTTKAPCLDGFTGQFYHIFK